PIKATYATNSRSCVVLSFRVAEVGVHFWTGPLGFARLGEPPEREFRFNSLKLRIGRSVLIGFRIAGPPYPYVSARFPCRICFSIFASFFGSCASRQDSHLQRCGCWRLGSARPRRSFPSSRVFC